VGIAELFEIGFFEAFWNWSNPILTALVYSCAAVGVILHIILQKIWRRATARWLPIGLCVIGILISECAWHIVTGWGRLSLLLIYGLILCILLGAILAAALSSLKPER